MEFQNELIRRYLICVTETETGNTFNYSTPLTSYMLYSLHPHYNYVIEVAAETVAPGLSSAPVVVQTLTDGTVVYYYVSMYELVCACVSKLCAYLPLLVTMKGYS